MNGPRQQVNERLHDFQEACKRMGLKVTHQRLEIFKAVVVTDEHPDAITVHKRVKKKIPTISLDTVYRNLKTMAEHGVLAIVGTSKEHLRFDANLGQHHHFTCVKCGAIKDFTSGLLAGLQIPDEAKGFGMPLSLQVEVKGVCSNCRKDGERQNS